MESGLDSWRGSGEHEVLALVERYRALVGLVGPMTAGVRAADFRRAQRRIRDR